MTEVLVADLTARPVPITGFAPTTPTGGEMAGGAGDTNLMLNGPNRPSRLPVPLIRVASLLQEIPNGLTYLGVLLVVVGFGLVAFGWGKVAKYHNVGDQLPYLASACFSGAGLVVCGVAIVLIASRQRDSDLRLEQLDTLTATLRAVGESLERNVANNPADHRAISAEVVVAAAAIRPARRRR